MSARLRSLWSSLELRLLLPLGLTIALLLTLNAVLSYWDARDEFSRFIRADLERSTTLVRSATHDGMLLNQMREVQTRVERLGSSPGFEVIRVYSKDGRIALSANPNEVGRVVELSDEACAACHPQGMRTGPGVLRVSIPVQTQRERESQRSLTVIKNEQSCATAACHPSPSERPVLGVLDVQMSMAPFSEAIDRARRQMGWTTTALILASGLITFGVIRRLVHEPVARLHEGTRKIAAGDLSTRIEVRGSHELAALASAFNAMVSDLQLARADLDRWSKTLELRVDEKTRALREAQARMTHVETMASLGKLSATVAHELNNPLSGILAYARLVKRELADQPMDPAVRAELDRDLTLIDKECVRCADIVKAMLTFARGQGVRPATTDMNQVVEHCLMLIRHHLEVHHVRLEASLLDGDPTLVADQGQLRQMVLALLMNAIEAMQGHTNSPSVLKVWVRGDSERMEVGIQDTGCGIPPELMPHIFEPFVTTKGETSGVGLGLSVVYGVVRGHGGEVGVQSRPGEGTTFTVTLPRRYVGGDTPMTPPALAAETNGAT